MVGRWSHLANRMKFLLAGDALETVNPRLPGRPHEQLVGIVSAGTAPHRVLELCAGTGYAARLLARSYPQAQIQALDVSPEMLAVGRRKLAREGIANVTLVPGDAGRLPFPDEFFDVVMAAFGLHELPTDVRRRALAEARRVLRSDGRLVVVDLDQPRSMRWAFALYMRIAERAHARQVLGDGLTSLLTNAGFSISGHRPACGRLLPFQLVEAKPA
jgi:demethylmenaquinone methyltransferase/2-methoxy-6-polyprenyl-1,4-benzoquinol methylase